MLAFGVRELVMFYIWAFEPYDDDEPETDDEIEPETRTRKILGNGFVYHSPIESEGENDVFEWTVERFRVEGDELKKDEDFGKNIF